MVREAFEESRGRVGETAYLGYQEVHRPDRAPYAQARIAGVVEAFAERAPDPDGSQGVRVGDGDPAQSEVQAAAPGPAESWAAVQATLC
jgi:hypothetical protein